MTVSEGTRRVRVIRVVGLVLVFSGPVTQLTLSTTDSGLWILVALSVLGGLGLLAIGSTILARQPQNVIGWLFLAILLFFWLWSLPQNYAEYTFVTNPGSLPFGRFAAWLMTWAVVPMFSAFIGIFLLFPDGHLPSNRWRPVLWLWLGSTLVATVAMALNPALICWSRELGPDSCARPLLPVAGMGTVAAVAGVLILITAFPAGASLVVRFRGAAGDERQQIRWLAFTGITFLALVPFLGLGPIVFAVEAAILLLGLPAACGLAILKYRLYDLDIVIRKTVVFGVLAVFITGVYAGIVGGIGALVDSRGSTTLSFAAAAALAVLFQPARERARRFADRVTYGKRATPYEVLAEFSGNVGETYATADVLPRMAQVLANGTGADSAKVFLRVGGELREAASFGEAGAGGEHLVPVVDRGEELGALAVTMSPSDPMDGTKEKLVRDLAGQAGLVLRNVRLIEELRASRQRLVKAQDEERRKLERNLHDGAQQQLVALAVKLRLAQAVASKEAATQTAQQLTALGQDAQDALENLRDLARGIYPPLLADKGLVVALEGQAHKAALPTTVSSEGVGRYAQDVEAAVYFCVLEALNNVAKYAEAATATVALTLENGHLAFAVADDGRGFDTDLTSYGTGLQGMADRLAALDGDIEVTSAPGSGTVVKGRVPTKALGR